MASVYFSPLEHLSSVRLFTLPVYDLSKLGVRGELIRGTTKQHKKTQKSTSTTQRVTFLPCTDSRAKHLNSSILYWWFVFDLVSDTCQVDFRVCHIWRDGRLLARSMTEFRMYREWEDSERYTDVDSPAGLIAEMSESSSMKNAGLDRPDSWCDRGLGCLEGELTMGGRRG